ncbi:DUF4926 domain-containing protein [Spirulina sp. 06S082]|uniref:DUF4926 domain-containing protein n=1 Tax=Spirulina sp. 06S082 TaxID=3110248 RepID=UPI002B1FF0F2|nr:DUF4926 domain-containing protein [Spirulina sp. 06S082]MEA5471602.1 DUF4926 domain-containing protein [Spirulina sp. 06S082]
MKQPNLLDSVTNLYPIPRDRLTLVESAYDSIINLPRGQIGTIVEIYNRSQESKYLVEFADSCGEEYAMAILKAEEILVISYELSLVS